MKQELANAHFIFTKYVYYFKKVIYVFYFILFHQFYVSTERMHKLDNEYFTLFNYHVCFLHVIGHVLFEHENVAKMQSISLSS